MSYLVDRKTELIFRTASLVTDSGKARSVVIESRPNYALVKLSGTQTRYPIAWEHIFHLAKSRHDANLRLEQETERQLKTKPERKRVQVRERKERQVAGQSR